MSEWLDILYPLGFLAQLVFCARVVVQWLESEIKSKSVASKTFWNLSIAGSALMFAHAFVQSQFPVCLAQVCNGVIAWRNLNLMQTEDRQITFNTMLKLLAASICCVAVLFFVQWHFVHNAETSWFRAPTYFKDHPEQGYSPIWHLAGTIGILLFASRFWVQWWDSEKEKESRLGASFWWISLIGAILSCAYFLRLADFVNLIGPASGAIPYVRNLMLLNKTHPALKAEIQSQ